VAEDTHFYHGNAKKDENFRIILDGSSLSGWKMCGPGGFDLINRSVISSGGMGLLWYKEKKFADFILRVHWKTSAKGDNSGVFIRFSDPDDDPWIAVNTGYEIQIYDGEPEDGNALHKTGAIYDFSPPSYDAANKPGEWNIFEIHAVGHNYAVILNNTRTTEFRGSRQVEGYIGLQNHDAGSRVTFGKIAVKEL
jgi:hypothetical protein